MVRNPNKTCHLKITGSASLGLFVDGGKSNNFEFFLACRGGYLHFVAHFAVKQSPADGRGCGDQALFDVGFFAANQLIFNLCVTLHIQNDQARAITSAVLRNVGQVEHAKVAHALFEVCRFWH